MKHRLKRWSVVSACIVALLLLGLWSAANAVPARLAGSPEIGGPITMGEAFAIAKPTAQEWDSNVKLYWINSVDSPNNANPNQGLDGKRLNWNVEFVVPGTERHYTVFISKGQIVAGTEFTNPTLWEPFSEFPNVAIDALLQSAQKSGLEPGDNVAFGYHFKLHKRDGHLAVDVIGKDKTSRERRAVRFDRAGASAKND